MDTGSASHSSATAVVISSATAANTSATVATAAVDPSLLSNATASLNLGLDTGKNNNKKSATNRLSGGEKIDNVHKSLGNAEEGVRLIESVKSFIEATNTDTNKSSNAAIIIDSLETAVAIFKEHIRSVSKLVDNTKEKSSSIQANRKLTANARRAAQHASLEAQRSMSKNPRNALMNAVKKAKHNAAVGASSSASVGEKRKMKSDDDSNSPPVASLPPRQRTKTSGGDKAQDGDAPPAPRVPRPADGRLVYYPHELKQVLKNLDEHIEELSGTKNKNEQRSFKARYKEELTAKGYAPLKSSAMNDFHKKYVKGDEEPPLMFNQKGGQEYLSLEELHAHLQKKGERVGQGWSYDDTRKAVYDAKKARAEKSGKDIRSIAEPHKKTVDAYHSALMGMPNIVNRTAQSKTAHRDIAETAVRAMLSNLSAMLSAFGVIESPEHPIPARFRFNANTASEGELMAREIFAKAHNVPVEAVHFLPKELFINADDMAVMYIPRQQDTRSQDLSVLVDASNTTNTSYGIHSRDVNSEPQTNGLKTRLTNTITGGGQYLPAFVQLPGFSESEIPRSKVPNGVVLFEVKGLSPDGNINPHSDQVVIVACMRGNEKDVETEAFRHYQAKVAGPSIKRIRQNLQLPSSSSSTQSRESITRHSKE